MKLSLHLVTWNGAKYIPYLFHSIKCQTYQDWQILILDNGSTDNTVELIKKELSTFIVQHQLTANTINIGFAGGHNQLMQNHSEFILLLNQDMYLMPDCLEKLVAVMEEHKEAGAVAPLLMRWQFPDGFTNEIDSLGMRVGRSRRVIEDCAGERWSAINLRCPDQTLEVFGISGAMMMLRRSILDEVALGGSNIFDTDYCSYKEDVDLAFRLCARGYRSFVALDAVAYHDRSVYASLDSSDTAVAVKNKKAQSLTVQRQSYRNHLMTLYKNEYWQNVLLDLPWILWYESKKFLYFLLFRPAVLRGLAEILRNRKKLRYKRREIREKRRVRWREMRRWWR